MAASEKDTDLTAPADASTAPAAAPAPAPAPVAGPITKKATGTGKGLAYFASIIHEDNEGGRTNTPILFNRIIKTEFPKVVYEDDTETRSEDPNEGLLAFLEAENEGLRKEASQLNLKLFDLARKNEGLQEEILSVHLQLFKKQSRSKPEASDDDIIQACTRALELNPSNIKVLLQRGELYEKLQHFKEAAADMQKILHLEPRNGQANENLERLSKLVAKECEMGKIKDEADGNFPPNGVQSIT